MLKDSNEKKVISSQLHDLVRAHFFPHSQIPEAMFYDNVSSVRKTLASCGSRFE